MTSTCLYPRLLRQAWMFQKMRFFNVLGSEEEGEEEEEEEKALQ